MAGSARGCAIYHTPVSEVPLPRVNYQSQEHSHHPLRRCPPRYPPPSRVASQKTHCLSAGHQLPLELHVLVQAREGKGLGAELQGIVKPILDVVMKSRWGLGYREKSKPWSSSTSTLKADREPLTWTLWCHFIRGPTQPGYNTVIVEAELSQHEVHGRNFSRHMAPLLTYGALEALRPNKRRKTGDPEAEWYRWFDIEDITNAFSRLFWEEERT
ncbi:hypothetical protein Taro_032413 [Colocasia esculenta]|uniref:G-patch domain-containing protein n=1 Tax=Colocasia esculenta TaxID=4460 RepID=A0A843W617_COLES|nr:hypothetical protein [Colocasia esculenta]